MCRNGTETSQHQRTDPLSPDPVLERLGALHPKLIDLSLGRIERLLAALDHPEHKLAPVIHIAGTNGKGSTAALLRAILEAAGKTVNVYTSPHLVRFAERIRLSGQVISDEALTDLLERVETANGGAPITFFEVTTAAAFLAFAEHPADVTILEVGLGGRLDATNVIDAPALTVITPVSMDHQQFLGDDLASIATEKAGILKPGVPCILAKQADAARAAIEARAAAIASPLICEGKDFDAKAKDGSLVYASPGQGTDQSYTLPLPNLEGVHQAQNAAVALRAAMEFLGCSADDPAMAQGLTTAVWPARLQRLTRGPMVEVLPEGWELWLDGGHNPAAGKALATSLAFWRDQPVYLIFGMMEGKDWDGFLQPLGFMDATYVVPIPGEAHVDPETIAESDRGFLMGIEVAKNPAAALGRLVGANPNPSRVLIAGSLYLAGQILQTHA